MTGVPRSGSRVGLRAFSCGLVVAPFLVPFFCFGGVCRVLGDTPAVWVTGRTVSGFCPECPRWVLGSCFFFPLLLPPPLLLHSPTYFLPPLPFLWPPLTSFTFSLGLREVSRLGDTPAVWVTGRTSLGFCPECPRWGCFFFLPSSYLAPCGFRLQAARVGRISWRWIRVAYQVARPAAIARSSCGYWPPWGRTAAISRSKMWACARDLSIRSNSVSSK